ncbi:unnamed protein product, partial [Discosporangium mesarthrocarpum]
MCLQELYCKQGDQSGCSRLLVVAPVKAQWGGESQTMTFRVTGLEINPWLSDRLKFDRVGIALSPMCRNGGSGVFVDDLYDWIHADKVWFHVMRVIQEAAGSGIVME